MPSVTSRAMLSLYLHLYRARLSIRSSCARQFNRIVLNLPRRIRRAKNPLLAHDRRVLRFFRCAAINGQTDLAGTFPPYRKVSPVSAGSSVKSQCLLPEATRRSRRGTFRLRSLRRGAGFQLIRSVFLRHYKRGILSSWPSARITFTRYPTGLPLFTGWSRIVTLSPGLSESLVQPALCRSAGCTLSQLQC